MDNTKLKEILDKRAVNVSWLARELNISRPTIDAKISKKTDWTSKEMELINELLRLSPQEFNEVFFNNRLVFYTRIVGNNDRCSELRKEG